MLVDELKKRILTARKSGDAVAREVLRVALGEIQTVEARTATTMDEAGAVAVVRKLVKSNEETLAATDDPLRRADLERELAVLRELLPASLGVPQLVELLGPVADAVRAAANDGAATGVAMKHLKASGAQAEGKDVAAAVRALRS